MTKKQGQKIAELINQIQVADLMIESALAGKDYDYDTWRESREAAENALRKIGIPVVKPNLERVSHHERTILRRRPRI